MLLPEIRHIDEDDLDVARPSSARRPTRRLRQLGFVAAVLVALLATAGGSTAWAAAKFSDVPDNHTFASDINWMANQGISEGYEDGTFRPTDDVTRQAMSAFLHRYNAKTSWVSKSVNTAGTVVAYISIECPQGTRPLAGGGTVYSDKFVMTDTVPTGNGWSVGWRTLDGSSKPANFVIHALCGPDL